MATPTPFRLLPVADRTMLVARMISTYPAARTAFIQRLASRKGGFRAQTFISWPADKLAGEVVRTNAQSAQDEVDLLQMLYVEVAPAVQITFLDAAGVKHDNGTMPEELAPPFCDEAATKRAVEAVWAKYGAECSHYLLTLATYARAGWPGIADAIETIKR